MDATEQEPIASAPRHGPEHRLERLIFFSDAVFAIAITLLVIEIHVPHLERGAGDVDFLRALAGLIPNFIGFVIGFFVIGAFWGGHHRAFSCAAHWDERLMPANIQLLMTIAALPFFTAFVSNYGNERVPVALYCSWLLLTALLNIRIGRLATSAPVVDASISQEMIESVRLRAVATALGAATAIVISLVVSNPFIAQISLASIPLWRLALARLSRPRRGGA